MAAQVHAAQQFRTVQIFKTQSLGLGSYGAVYKAKADQLPCAAKLLHPILFQDRDPGARRILQRFEQECQFLNGIRHPNIVQYLGTCTDHDSGLPALLMELMDKSLTHFLETSQEPLPYHLEVNISHDIALALDYLHSNRIVHRDLSSNNVLLIGAGSRAKITDFGMSKLLDTALHATPQTQCPGTISYMSPEALRIPPVYSKKLDCFSFGVLGIQIMTRQFPDPGPAKQVIDYPKSPVGTIEMPVLERERRKKHIDLISPNHPLLSTALRCLEYHEKNRPSAQELCDQLATLKEDPTYTQSVTREEERGRNAAAGIAAKDEQVEELQRNLSASATAIEDMQRNLKARDRDVEDLQQLLLNERKLLTGFQQRLLQKEEDNHDLRAAKNKQIAELQRNLAARDRDVEDVQRRLAARDRDVEDVQRNLAVCTRAVEGVQQQLQNERELKADLQQSLFQKQAEILNFHEIIRVLQEQPQSTHKQERSPAKSKPEVVALDWEQNRSPPEYLNLFETATAVDGSTVYAYQPLAAYAYNSQSDNWTRLPNCPMENNSLAMVNGLLTAVGGRQLGKVTNTLTSLVGEGNDRKWVKRFPPMPTARMHPTVVCSGKSLVAAGGEDDAKRLSTVEVMDTDALKWFTASSLPHPLFHASVTVYSNDLYIMGGFDGNGKVTKSVFTCSLTALLQSRHPQAPEQQLRALTLADVWHKVADAPLYRSTCTAFCGQLLAIGGDENDGQKSNAVYKYDLAKNNWSIISRMPQATWLPLVEVLPGNKLMVFSGRCAYTACIVQH